MIWVCSDWHLGHDKLVNLGYRPEGHDRMVIERVRSVVEWGTLLNLGDVYLDRAGEAMARSLLTSLHDVSKILVRGNHDGKRMAKLQEMGWNWICESTTIVYHGKRLLFTHEPVAIPEDVETINVHGHLHSVSGHRGDLIRDGKHILISAELMDYRPITLDRLVELGETPVFKDGKFIALSRFEGNKKDPVWDRVPMPIEYTCPCGMYVHPTRRNQNQIHASDCPYRSVEKL